LCEDIANVLALIFTVGEFVNTNSIASLWLQSIEINDDIRVSLSERFRETNESSYPRATILIAASAVTTTAPEGTSGILFQDLALNAVVVIRSVPTISIPSSIFSRAATPLIAPRIVSLLSLYQIGYHFGRLGDQS
jgi:hypothetical protein